MKGTKIQKTRGEEEGGKIINKYAKTMKDQKHNIETKHG